MTRNGNGCVKWVAFVPILLGICGVCMGATSHLLDKQERTIHQTLEIMRVDLREVRQDVKTLLKGE